MLHKPISQPALSAAALEYADCISAEELDPPPIRRVF